MPLSTAHKTIITMSLRACSLFLVSRRGSAKSAKYGWGSVTWLNLLTHSIKTTILIALHPMIQTLDSAIALAAQVGWLQMGA
jgi:hypothetical protein